MPTKWELIEPFISNCYVDDTEFTARKYARLEGISIDEASSRIQSYLRAQRRGETMWTIFRKPGTRVNSSVWIVGSDMEDAPIVTESGRSDIKVHITRALIPDVANMMRTDPNSNELIKEEIEDLNTEIELMFRRLKRRGKRS